MKIAFLIPSLNSGGMERVMSQILQYFAKNKDAELHLVLFGPTRDIIFYDIPSSVIIHKHSIPYSDKKRIQYSIRSCLYIRKCIKEINPNTILCFGEIWNSFVLLSLIGLKYPIYVSDRCQPNKRFSSFHEYLRKWLYPQAAGIIAQTQQAKYFYSKQFHHSNISVIGNPIRSIENVEYNDRENIIISIGRLINSKNFDQLIDIFSRINNPDWKLIIVGGDSLKQHNSTLLKQQIEKNNMSERIILAGTQKDVESYLLRSKIFAFTSSSEGFPNVIGEAMSAGLPVVAYDCIAGPSDMITDGEDGYLVPLFDKVEFERKLSYMMNNEALLLNMSENAKKNICRFSVSEICEKYYNTITQL